MTLSADGTGQRPERYDAPLRVVVVAASRHGSTFGIADAIRNCLDAEGIEARLFVADSFDSFEGADAVVLGSAVYMGHWMTSAEALLNQYASELANLPVWLFSSGPVSDSIPLERAAPRAIERAADRINARDHRVFKGRIDHSNLGVGERNMLESLAVDNGDARDGDDIGAWSQSIADELNGARDELVGARAGDRFERR
jgi:menaquinone-dependent protoporphyrinogen oxidase